jgi:hypothetical protein
LHSQHSNNHKYKSYGYGFIEPHLILSFLS